MNISASGAFEYFRIHLFGLEISITQTTISSFLITVLLCTCFVIFGKNLKKRPGKRQVLVEKAVSMFTGMVRDTMGAHNLHWTPFIATIFLSSMLGSYIGLLGFFRSTTADLSCVAVWAISVSIIIWAINIKNNGLLNWLKGFTEPIFIMTPMNLISEIAQPLSMTFRQFGNLTGGGIITSIVYGALAMVSTLLLNMVENSGIAVAIVLTVFGIGLMAWHMKKKKLIKLIFGIAALVLGLFGMLQIFDILRDVPIFTYGIPAVLSCYFDLFSGFVQAYVFTLLTMAYIGGALPGPAEAEAQA